MLVEFYGLEFDLPDGWEDVTGDDSPPALARPTGLGAVQFSFFSIGDEHPRLTIDDLRKELTEFGDDTGRVFEKPTERIGKITCVGGRSFSDGQFCAAWFLSDGSNVVFVTYFGPDPSNPEVSLELKDAEHIVSTIDF